MILLEVSKNDELLYRIGGEDLEKMSVSIDASGCLGELSKSSDLVFSSVQAFATNENEANTGGEVRKWEKKSTVLNDVIKVKIIYRDEDISDPHIDSQTLKSIKDEYDRLEFEKAKKVYFNLKEKFEPEV